MCHFFSVNPLLVVSDERNPATAVHRRIYFPLCKSGLLRSKGENRSGASSFTDSDTSGGERKTKPHYPLVLIAEISPSAEWLLGGWHLAQEEEQVDS